VLSHPIHQQVVIDVVEAAFDIAFNDPLIRCIVTFAVRFASAPRPHCHTDVLERTMTSASWPKAIRDMPESRFEDWFQKLFDRALNDTVRDRRDGQCELHLPTTRIWDSPRSVTLSTPFGVGGSKYSRSDASPASTL
jgi:hypothetical protein